MTASLQKIRKWSRRRDVRPQEIVAAALTLFCHRGYAATKLEDVARAAGIAKGTIYLYFATKEVLFQAVVRQELLPNLDLAERQAEQTDSAILALRQMAERVVQIADSTLGGIPKLVLTEAGNFPEIARFYADEVVARGARFFDRIIQRGISSGEFRPIDAALLLPSFIGPLLSMVLWRHSIGRHSAFPFDSRAAIDAHLELFLRGLAVEPGS